MSLLQRKIPKKTPLTSKALDVLTSDIVKAPEPFLNEPENKPHRVYTPPPVSTLKASSIFNTEVKHPSSTFNHEFSAKLRANLAANLLASPTRMDKLSRTLLPSQLMIKFGFAAETTEGQKKLRLAPDLSNNSAGSKGYFQCKKAAIEALSVKNRWLSIVPVMVATSSKSAQSTFLAPLNQTINWLKKKKSNNPPSTPPPVVFEFEPELSETIPDLLINQIKNLLVTSIFQHHILRLGLEIPKGEHYFVLSWEADLPPMSEFCSEVIYVPDILSSDHSNQLFGLFKENCKIMKKDQFIKIPSSQGLPLQILLWKYQNYLK